MKVLLIDSGNSRIKFCVVTAEHKRAQVQFTLEKQQLHKLKNLFKHEEICPDFALGVNVAEAEVEMKIQQQLPQNCELRWLRPQTQLLHLKNNYEQPASLGADRWLAMLGVSGHTDSTQRPFILANFGTATTIDTVYKNEFYGGMILPGLQLMGESLYQGTANLPRIDWQKEFWSSTFATNTMTAIETGILSAQAGAILRQWYCVRDQFKWEPLIFVAGGAYLNVLRELRRLMAQVMSHNEFATISLGVFEDPVLEGLRLCAFTGGFTA